MSSHPLRGRPASGEGAPSWRLARVLRVTVAKVLLALFRTRIDGVEHVPSGGAILAGNHESHLDPALLWCAVPRPAHFVAKSDLWKVGWLGWALDRLWAIPVDRDRSSADRAMITMATDLLTRGELVGMFPEGTRAAQDGSDELGAAHGGVSFIALRAGVPVVPVGFAGTKEALPRGAHWPRFTRVAIRLGEPIDPASFTGGRKERTAELTRVLMERITAERDRARRLVQ